MKRATVYIVILGIVCTGLGLAAGMALEKRRIAKNLPKIIRHQLLKKQSQAGRVLGRKPGFAQQRGQKPGADKVLGRISQELNLSAEQKEQVKAALETTKGQVKQARDEFKTEVGQIKKEGNARILELLDPEQQEKFQELTARIKEREEQGPKRQPGKSRLE